jgi:hypothetical protein
LLLAFLLVLPAARADEKNQATKVTFDQAVQLFSTWLQWLTVNIVLMHFRKKRHPEVSLAELHLNEKRGALCH